MGGNLALKTQFGATIVGPAADAGRIPGIDLVVFGIVLILVVRFPPRDLPGLLETALLNAGKELRTGIATIMESALRDFLARRKQLHLPLEETGND